ncbi:MAG: class I SAM-dependent methyltransferase [Chloroflexi bacterium]|nr:class I SAM-dependent methyltransferase [Chloroflexota bacterium]
MMKSTVDQIRQRFDADVERFSNLETGQSATIDAPLVLDLITAAAAATNPQATRSLDIGCGAGNYTLKLLAHLPNLAVTLIDLSAPMLERAVTRIGALTSQPITTLQCDIRDIEVEAESFDIIMAAAVFHHLRGDDEWRSVFARCYAALKPGGSMWISDLIEHDSPAIQVLMWQRYGEYLTQLKGEAYRETVYGYIEQEDTPRPLLWQLHLLKEVGFKTVEILHKNSVFAAFGAIKTQAS